MICLNKLIKTYSNVLLHRPDFLGYFRLYKPFILDFSNHFYSCTKDMSTND